MRASNATYVGPAGSWPASAVARMRLSAAAVTDLGSSSHFTNWRTGAAWSAVVCSQSIHGRRSAASTGPFEPSTTTGTRSQNALKIAMLACMRPTLVCSATSIGRPVTLAYPCAMATACSSCRQRTIFGPRLPR
jgi:hypothetical protein